MRHGPRGRVTLAAAFVALAALGLAMAEDAFFHTDDGCVVEVHCLACLWHSGAVVVAPVAVTFAVTPSPLWNVFVPPSHVSTDATPRTKPSRGPPPA